LTKYEIEINKEEDQCEEGYKEELFKGKEEYARAADALIMEAQETNEDIKRDIQNYIQLIKDTNRYNKDMQNLLKSTNIRISYLKQLSNKQDELKDNYEQLITWKETPMNIYEEFKSNKEELEKIQEELKDKSYEIEQLKLSLKELINDNNEAVRKKRQVRNEERKELLKIDELNNKLEEIKGLIVNQRKTKSIAKPPVLLIREKRSDKPVNEIRRFVEAEKERLFVQKKALTENYDVSVKLLKSNQSNLTEWKNEISQHQVDETHSLIDNLKSGLDNQVDVLIQQVDKLK
jgi:hypothetical protein